MKQLFILLIASTLFTIGAKAQDTESAGPSINKSAVDADDEEEVTTTKAASKVVYADPSSMESTTIHQDGHKLTLNDLPPMNSMVAHITDANGNELVKRKVNSKSNTVDITRLRKGMHYVTLVSESTGKRKAFTLTVE